MSAYINIIVVQRIYVFGMLFLRWLIARYFWNLETKDNISKTFARERNNYMHIFRENCKSIRTNYTKTNRKPYQYF